MTEKKKGLVIFDFDGVLADSLPVYYDIFRSLRKKGDDIVKNEEDFLSLFDGNVVSELRKKGMTATELISLWRQFEKGVEKRGIKIYDGVPEMLMALKEKNTLAVISSNSTSLVEGVLKRHQMARYFSGVLGGEKRETKTERIFWLKRQFQVYDEDACYVGDTVGDIKEAKAANIKSVAALWGWHDKARLAKARPDFMAKSPANLVKVVEKIFE